MKKCLPVLLTALLILSALTGCAGQKPLSQPDHTSGQSSEPAVRRTITPETGASALSLSPTASEAYEKLTAYKTGNYSRQSVADFNAALASTPDELTEFLAAQAGVISVISPHDENYDFFMTTLTFSANELYCQHMGEESTLYIPLSKKSRPCNVLDEDGEMTYAFYCFADLQVPYSITSADHLTVGERDQIILTFKEEMQNYLNNLSEPEITNGNIRTMLTDKAAELANSLSTENMTLSPCEIPLLEINDSGTEIIP